MRAPHWVLDYNAKVYRCKLHLDAATSLDLDLDSRLDSFKKALAVWPEGSYERKDIEKSYLTYMGLLAEESVK